MPTKLDQQDADPDALTVRPGRAVTYHFPIRVSRPVQGFARSADSVGATPSHDVDPPR